MESIKNRRTIRKYKDKDVSKDLIDRLLETSFRAPTMGNMQLYSVVVTRDVEMKKKLAPAHFNQPMVMEAPVLLTFCADFNRFVKWCEESDAIPGYDNFLSFMNAATDALLVTQEFITLAEEEGLGTCYLGTTIYNSKQIIDILKLPKLVVPIATITVGYPGESPAQTDRIDFRAIVHDEVYKDYSSEDIKSIYKEKEGLEESLKFIEENNKKTLAQVYTDVRYKRGDNEYISKLLLDALKEQGFIEK